ncbi:carboxypeptidase-like regulatory domain-containing protein [Flavitalea sp. BT771]|uniref:TonB-dependent receptor n=1 Tax=Flavitalea sp. BT771 TaxID=3063329 RepID=UPI0026E46AA7|nr:TonB-dependent receptor [Flavitalea sp. BT771]MDO6432854.1 carboxypeptidase-like regulatory domain-containing protein [Flavitalea sp. BT771]MDV6221870.1 carboxypeptidase-like regulatory domain-containing protein [Flavitalea sp. BT771]
MHRNIFTALALIFTASASAIAGGIKGYVYDKHTKEQLIGATVTLQPSHLKSTSSLDGGFLFKDLDEATYQLHVSYVGYAAMDTSIVVRKNGITTVNIYLTRQATSISDVMVTSALNGGSDEFAKRREMSANSIVNIVSSNAIAISPDITVANVMQRISGVSIERGSSGDGQYAIIRGMDKRYNTTLVNGVKIPSPDNRNRYVPLDIFPAELLDRIEVIKSLTPDMEADAAGGVINLVMKNAGNKFRLEGNVGTGYSDLYFNRDFYSYMKGSINVKSPAEITGPGVFAPLSAFPYQNVVTTGGHAPINKNANLTVSDRLLKNKLGIIFSGSYQNAYRGSNSNTLLQSPTVPPAADETHPQLPAFSDIYARRYSSRIDRSGVETKIDYDLNAGNSISLFATYLQLNERRTRLTSDSLLGGYSTANDYVGPYAIYDKAETRSDLQSIYNATLQGKHKLSGGFTTDWSLVASRAKREVPDNAQFSTARGVNPNTNTGTYTISPPVVRNQSREWIRNTDKDLAGYLNFHYAKDIAGHHALFGLGGMYRHKQRDNYDNAYDLTPVSDPNSNDEQYISIPASKFTFVPANGALGNAAGNPGIYNFKEDVGAAYGQVKYNVSPALELLGGLRMESTHQQYISSLPVSVDGKSADIKYIDLLPSLQAKYSFDERKALRFSYFRSIFRPAFADLIAFPERGSSNDSYETEGNPHLQHTTIDNFDLRYEIFPKGLDQFMIGAFYKMITDPIEYAFTQSGFGGIVLSPNNFGNANNFGVELVFRKYIGNFGVSGNYTYTHSDINAAKNFYYQSSGGQALNVRVDEHRPLQGQSAHIGNFSFLYKSRRNKIDAQIALVYTGERINTLSLYKGLDNWEKPTVNLDLSAQKEFGKHYILYVKVNNILNTPFHLVIKQNNSSYSGKFRLPFQESPHYITVQYDKFYATYSMGFRFKF